MTPLKPDPSALSILAISSISPPTMIVDVSNQNLFSFANPRVEDYDQSATKDVLIESGRELDDHKIVTLIRRAASLDYSYYKQGVKGTEHEDDFSTSSNLLWKNRGFLTSSSASGSPMHYSTLRAQEIARYRQEMMDLVRGMPESAYELSFRDMVETDPRLVKKVEEAGTKNKADRKLGPRRLPRNDTMNGLFLKTFVPVLGTGGKMKRSRSNSSAKVSPKPEENEFGDRESTSRRSSEKSSRSTSRRSSSRIMSGCYAFTFFFFFTKKSKSKETSKQLVE